MVVGDTSHGNSVFGIDLNSVSQIRFHSDEFFIKTVSTAYNFG